MSVLFCEIHSRQFLYTRSNIKQVWLVFLLSSTCWKPFLVLCFCHKSGTIFIKFLDISAVTVNLFFIYVIEVPCLESCNKRPRGLDALLGHLLVKRIPVMFQLSSAKIPGYLSQK